MVECSSTKWDISIIPSSQLRHKRSQKDCKSQRGIEPNPRFASYLVCILCGFPGSGIEELGRKYLLNNAVFDFIILTKQSTCKSNVQIKSLFFTGKGEMKSEQGSKQIEYGKISKFSKFSISLFFALTVDIDLILSYIFFALSCLTVLTSIFFFLTSPSLPPSLLPLLLFLFLRVLVYTSQVHKD